MWPLNRFLRTPRKSQVENSKPLSLPPYDLLDRHFRLPDDAELKIIGFQYGGKFLDVPFVVRCRVLETGELVLIDPDYVRRFGYDMTPFDAKKEALRKPFVPRKEEVARVIGWKSQTKFGKDNRPVTELVRLTDTNRGEGRV